MADDLRPLIYIYIYVLYRYIRIRVYNIYKWSPPPPGPTFSHPRRGRCHRDIYNKIVHSTETMEKTVKNEHLSKWKLICTESKNCCKSVLFRPKFGLESHGLKYIWYPPQKKPTSLHVLLVFAPVVWLCQKKNKKPRENQNKKQYSRTLAKAKIKKTSRKPKKSKKQYSRTLAKVKMQKSKKPRENQKNPKNQKKQYSRSLEIGSTGKSPGTLFFLLFLGFLVFSRFFGFLHFYFCKSPGILFFLFFLVFSRCFGFLLLQESWNTVFFWFSRGFLNCFLLF